MSTVHTEESRWTGVQEVSRMAWPIVLGTLSWTLMQFVDTAMVGRLGKEPLAAVGSAALWSYTLASFIIGIVACVSTFVAQSLGRGEYENCARYTWQGVYLSFTAGALALLLWPVSGAIFASMNHGPVVTALEVEYFQIRLFGYVFIAWQAALASFFQAINRPKVPMYVAMAAVALNAVLDYLLIFGKFGFPAMGVAGAAWATVIALAFQVALLQGAFMSSEIDREYHSRRTWRFDLTKSRELVAIGVPAGIAMVLDITNWAIFTSYIVGYFGATVLAAHNVAITLMHVSFMPALAVNHAIAPIVGQWIGRGDHARAKARTYTATKMTMVHMFATGIVFAIFGPWLMRMFTDEVEVIAIGRVLLIMAAVFGTFDAITITVSGALRGAGDTRWIAVVTAIAAYAIFLPAALTLSFVLNFGAIGAWYGATIYIIALSGIVLWRFHSERWRNISIFTGSLMPSPIPMGAAPSETPVSPPPADPA